MRGSISMGRLWGIPFYISYTWFVIFVIVTASLVFGQFPRSYPGWSDATYVFVGIITSLLFFASVVAHELAHGLVASSLGVPVISITLFIFGGIAQIGREAPRPQGELVIAAVGPFSSLALAALFGLVWIVARPFHDPTAAVAGWLAVINLSLAAFNLVPG
ncbi:MAG: srebp protease/cbs domain, partial [Dehalococcoidia bacterium]|nr:srebp protease/cbs domain [Dehalococcoidia bacterium]